MRYMKDGVSENDFMQDVKKYTTFEASSLEARKLLEGILKKYNIANETFHYRVRSLFGKSTSELRRSYFTPSKETMFDVIRRCNSAEEFWEALKIPKSYRAGLFDSYFGTSNFKNAKAIAEEHLFVQPSYNPSIKDNEALIAACLLGDGSFDKARNSLRIEHGHKQEEWLKKKVQMLKLAFPYLPTEVKKRVRGETGYTSYAYCSRKLQGKALHVLNACLAGDYEQFFTPLFLWVLFMDDGSNTRLTHQICYGSNGENFGNALIKYLSSFGITAYLHKEAMSVLIRKKVDRVKFCKLLKQFEHMTPESMKYKLAYKV